MSASPLSCPCAIFISVIHLLLAAPRSVWQTKCYLQDEPETEFPNSIETFGWHKIHSYLLAWAPCNGWWLRGMTWQSLAVSLWVLVKQASLDQPTTRTSGQDWNFLSHLKGERSPLSCVPLITEDECLSCSKWPRFRNVSFLYREDLQ